MLPHGYIQSDQGFGFLDMFMTKEKLSVEIAQVDCVQINNVDFPEPGQN